MNARTAIGLALLILECVVLALAGGRYIHVLAPLGFALVLMPAGRPLRMTLRTYLYVLGALGIAGALWWTIAPPRPSNMLHMFPAGGSSLMYVMGLYCLWHQALQLVVVLRRPFGDLSGPFPSFPFVGVFIMAIAGHFSYWATRHTGYTGVATLFVLLTVSYYLSRDGGWVMARYTAALKTVTLGLLAFALAAGIATASAIQRNENLINALLDRFTVSGPAESALGFSREGRLTNVTERRGANDQRPALFVKSDHVPGYLRGLVFDAYRDGRWSLPNPDRWIHPEVQDSSESRRLFRVADDKVTEPSITLEIFTSGALLDTLFLPLTATAVLVDTESIGIDRANAVRETIPLRRHGYSTIEPASPVATPPTDDELAQYTLVAALDRRVVELAAQITEGATTPRQKAAAVETYFLNQYEYEIGIQVPPGRDPLTYFLLERPAAHCEYFATGAAILLRLSGVPTRYVTGFLTVERNDAGDFYVARNQDAHAWVEAWDPETGWFIVEATPPAGVPSARESTRLSAWRDSLALAWSEFRDQLSTDPFEAVANAMVAAFQAVVRSTYGVIIVVALLALLVLHYARRRLRKRRGDVVSEDVRRLRSLVTQADSIARAAGLIRGESETVRAFADRIASADSAGSIQELAQWYREYERVRYRDTDNPQAYAFLQAALPVDQ